MCRSTSVKKRNRVNSYGGEIMGFDYGEELEDESYL